MKEIERNRESSKKIGQWDIERVRERESDRIRETLKEELQHFITKAKRSQNDNIFIIWKPVPSRVNLRSSSRLT